MNDQRNKMEANFHPAVTVLMILLGLPLLLPGVCSYLFARLGASSSIGGVGFLISLGGLALIFFGVRRLIFPASTVTVSEGVKVRLLLVLLVIIVLAGLGFGFVFYQLSQIKHWNN